MAEHSQDTRAIAVVSPRVTQVPNTVAKRILAQLNYNSTALSVLTHLAMSHEAEGNLRTR